MNENLHCNTSKIALWDHSLHCCVCCVKLVRVNHLRSLMNVCLHQYLQMEVWGGSSPLDNDCHSSCVPLSVISSGLWLVSHVKSILLVTSIRVLPVSVCIKRFCVVFCKIGNCIGLAMSFKDFIWHNHIWNQQVVDSFILNDHIFKYINSDLCTPSKKCLDAFMNSILRAFQEASKWSRFCICAYDWKWNYGQYVCLRGWGDHIQKS